MRHRRLPRLDLKERTYCLTCCTEGRRDFLQDPRFAQGLINLYVEARERGDIVLHGYVVMPDHYHVLFTLVGENSVSNLVRRVHSVLSRRARRELGITDRVWQRRFYDHVVRDDDDWNEQLGYIHTNPVLAGLVEEAKEYRWSSCRFWQTGEGPVRCTGPWW